MQAIATAIDAPQSDVIGEIWGELKAVFGLQGLAGATRPHLIYHVAEAYASATGPALARIAATTPAFAIATDGVAVVRAGQTVLVLRVVRDIALDTLHAAIWRAAAPSATGGKDAYAPATWAPHIALAIGQLDEAQLPEIMRLLGRRDYRWQLPATNVCLNPDTARADAEWRRYDLSTM